jgi:hypothetical protein
MAYAAPHAEATLVENSLPLIAMPLSAKQPGPENFLKDLLPVEGPYWILAYRHGSGMAHESLDSVDKLEARIEELEALGVEVWYAVASFMHRHDEAIAGGKECWGRKRENVACLAAFFLDIDVNPDKPGEAYSTIEDAERAVAAFEAAFGERSHCLVHSGGGLHVYWSLSESVSPKEWRDIALKFKDATKVAGLLADPVRTADPASLLRPTGTTNRKSKYGPTGRPVDGKWCRFERMSLDAFKVACHRVIGKGLMINDSVPPVTSVLKGVTLATTPPQSWFDDLPEDVKRQALRSMLASLPIEYVTDRARWLSVGAALSCTEGLLHDDRFNLWSEWSQSTEKGSASWCEESIDDQRRRWDGLNRSNVGALIILAKSAGWLPERLLDNTESQTAFLAIVEAQDANGERWSMAQAVTYVSEHVIYVRADNQYFLDGLPLTKEALDTSLARRMPISQDRQKTASYLVKNGAGLIVDHLSYKPGVGRTFIDRDGRKNANTWRRHPIEPSKPSPEDARALLDLIKHVANGNAETAIGIKRLFVKYAFLYRNPSARIRHATLLIGKIEGCGKSTITCAIPNALFGGANVRAVENKELSSDFNGYAQGARILVFPELWLGSRKDAQTQANNLKPLISEDYIPVVKKGKDGRTVENCTTIFASSNHADAAVFGDYDRRYDVIMTFAPRMPIELAERVYSLIDARPGALLWLILRLFGKDADSFNPHAAPPLTAAKRGMMEAGRGDWAQRMRDEFDAGNWPFNGDAVAASDVRLLLGSEYQPPPSDRAIHQELLSMADRAYSVLAQRRQGASLQQKRVIVFRNISNWTEAGPTALYCHYVETVKKGAIG